VTKFKNKGMQTHQLSTTNNRDKKRIARGGAHGVFSGRGAKGQRSRAGRNFQPIIRQFVKRYPKKRGYRFEVIELKPIILELEAVAKKFQANEIVSPSTLCEKGLISIWHGYYPEVKILGTCKLDKVLKVSGVKISNSARKCIEEAGGKAIYIAKAKPAGKQKKAKPAKEAKEVKEVVAKKETPSKKAEKKTAK